MGAIYSVMRGKGAKATVHTVHAESSDQAAFKVGQAIGNGSNQDGHGPVSTFAAGEPASSQHVTSGEAGDVREVTGAPKRDELSRHAQGRNDGYVKS